MAYILSNFANNKCKEGYIMKECIFGLALGVLVGALVVTSSSKAQDMVEKGKEMISKNMKKLAKK